MTINELETKIYTVKQRDEKIQCVKEQLNLLLNTPCNEQRTVSMNIKYSGPDAPNFELTSQECDYLNQTLRNILGFALNDLERQAENDTIKIENVWNLQDTLAAAKNIEFKLTCISLNIRDIEKMDELSPNLSIYIGKELILSKRELSPHHNFIKEHVLAILKDSEDYWQKELDKLLDIKGL